MQDETKRRQRETTPDAAYIPFRAGPDVVQCLDELAQRCDGNRSAAIRACIRKAVHDALPAKTDPLELDAAIEVALRENAELGKRYDELAKMVDKRMGELEAENELLRAELEAMDAKLEVESSFEEKGETYVAFYRVPAGPWHKILGLIRG